MSRTSFAVSSGTSLILACTFWAVATVASKQLLTAVAPLTLLVLQLAPSVAVLWILAAVRSRPMPAWRDLVPIAAAGFLNPGLSYTLSMLGLAQTPASVATLLWAAEPAFIIALAWVILREAITARFVILTATAACGIILVSGFAGAATAATSGSAGALLILGGVLCCALYTVLSRRFGADVDPLLAVALQQTVGLAWALSIWPLELHGSAADAVCAVPLAGLAAAAATGLMYYAIAFWLYLSGLRTVPASTAGVYLNLTPVFGVAIAYACLGERLSELQWAGAAVILISVIGLLKWPGTSRIDG